MITECPTLRAALLGGASAQPDITIAYSQQTFAFQLGGPQHVDAPTAMSDAHHDRTDRVLFGDNLLAANKLLSLFHSANWRENPGGWYYRAGASATTQFLGGAAVYTGSRPGLIANPGTPPPDARVFYLTTDGGLVYRDAAFDGTTLTWSGTESVEYLCEVGAASGLTIAPLSMTECFIIGYSSPVLWIQYVQLLGPGAWSAGAQQTLAVTDNLSWAAGTWGDAEPHPTDSNLAILTACTEYQGGSTALRYNKATDTYSPARFILAPTGTDWLRRVYCSALSTVNGRVWGVVQTDLAGAPNLYYAGHTALVSTADGLNWRDEGYVHQRDVRGKFGLLPTTGAATLLSPSYLVSDTAGCSRMTPGVYTVPTQGLLGVKLQRAGNLTAAELEVTYAEDPGRGIGQRIELRVGDGTTDSLQFVGYVDQPATAIALGIRTTTLLARGPLSRLLGETAYQPATTLEWRGRQSWSTDFHEGSIPVTGLAVYEGDLLAELEAAGARYGLTCKTTGYAVIPLRWQNPDVVCGARFRTDKNAGLMFYIGSDETYPTDRWECGLLDGHLVIGQYVNGLWVLMADAGAPAGYTAGTECEIQVRLTTKGITGYLVGAGLPATWPTVSYTPWTATAAPSAPPPNPHAIGVWADLDADQTAAFYHVWACDGEAPLSIQEVLASVLELAGVMPNMNTLALTTARVDNINVQLTYTAPGEGLYLFGTRGATDGSDGIPLQLYATYATYGALYIPFAQTLVAGASVQIVADDDCLSLYQHDRLLGALSTSTPRHQTTLALLGGLALFTMPELYQPAYWVAWDANQPASALLQMLLLDRRIYLVERADGTVDIRRNLATGAILIDATHPVGALTAYRYALVSSGRSEDVRTLAGIVGLTTINGERVYALDAEAAPFSTRVLLTDSQYIATPQAALAEVKRIIEEHRRARRQRQIEGLWDIAAEVGDQLAVYDGAIFDGLLEGFTAEARMTDAGLLFNWQATISQLPSAPPTPITWGSGATFGNAYWS